MPSMTASPVATAIHVLLNAGKGVDARDIGERSDAVLWTAMAGMTNDR